MSRAKILFIVIWGGLLVSLVLLASSLIHTPIQARNSMSLQNERELIARTNPDSANMLASSLTENTIVLFADDFDRADGDTVGNEWVEVETPGGEIGNSAGRMCFLDTSSPDNLLLIRHGFQQVSSGKLQWDFEFDWALTGPERSYSLFMQLGEGALLDDSALDSGVGVNLIWTQIDRNHETLGWRDNGENSVITTLSSAHNISVLADLDAKVYQVSVDGVVEASDLPFEDPVNLDTMRFFTDSFNEDNFSGRCFDNLWLASLNSSTSESTSTTTPEPTTTDTPTLLPTATTTDPRLPTPTPTTGPSLTAPPTSSPPTASPTASPTTDPRLPTPTPTMTQTPLSTLQPSGNLLINPGFADDTGECFGVITTAQITGWSHEHFGFGGTQENFPTNQEWPVCAARTKGELHGPGEGSIPEGETGKLWQTVAAPSYSAIIFQDARMEHEDGVVTHRIYGCDDPDGISCTLIAETTATVPQVETKSVCDAYVQIIMVDAASGVSEVEYADPAAGCPVENLPAPVTFSANFEVYPYLQVAVEVDPLPDGQGRSGYKPGWWSLDILP